MARHSLTIAVAQPVCIGGDVEANAVAHAAAVRAAGAQVVVFPEMSLTGYHLSSPAVAVDDATLAPLIAACAETGTVALAGSAVVGPTGTGRSIGTLAIGADGGIEVAYRKMWLGAPEMDAGFVPGVDPAVVDVDGWRVGLAVCKDTRHAEHSTATAALGIDVYVAGIVHGADEPDEHDRRARRVIVDHRVAVATASFAGSTGEGYLCTAGNSAIWAADGTELARAGFDPGDVAVATLPPG